MTKLRAVLRRRWPLLLFGVVVGALAGIGSSLMAPDDGEVSYSVSQLVVANRSAGTQGLVDQDALRVTRGKVAEQAAAALGLDDVRTATSGVSATADQDSGSIEVSVTNEDPDEATRRSEAFVAAFLDVVNSDLQVNQETRFAEIQTQIDSAQKLLDEFDAQYPVLDASVTGGDEVALQALVAQRSQLEDQVTQAEEALRQERLDARATLPYSTLGADSPKTVDSDLLPVPTSAPFRAGLLGFFGLALAVGAVMIIERLAPRIDSRTELADVSGLPVLSEVGKFAKKSKPVDRDGTLVLEGPWAEPYRRIRSAIQFSQSRSKAQDGRENINVVLITSPSPSDGKSTTTALTAMALAETGQITLVVGGDFRRPSIHELLGVTAHPGLRDYAQIAMERPTTAQVVKESRYKNLYVAPAGSGGKEIAGLPEATRELTAEAVDQGATVLIDSSPLEVANDTIDLLPAADAVILLVRSGHTTVRSLEHSLESLEQHGATVMGVVLIGAPGVGKRQYYYEGYYTPTETESSWPAPPVPPEGPRSNPPPSAGEPSQSPATPPVFRPEAQPHTSVPNNGSAEPSADREVTHTPRWTPGPGHTGTVGPDPAGPRA